MRLIPRQTITAGSRVVTEYKAVGRNVTVDNLDRATHPRIIWRQKSDKRYKQHAGVRLLGAAALFASD
jgi:hypothetical protein